MAGRKIPEDMHAFLNEVQEAIKLINEYTSQEMISEFEKDEGVIISASLPLPILISRCFHKFFGSNRKISQHRKRGAEIQDALNILDSEVIKSRSHTGWASLAPGVDASPKPNFKVRNSVQQAICPALQDVTGDSFEIAKITAPLLLSLSLAGEINLPASSLVFGLFAVLLSKAGVENVCRPAQKIQEL